MTTSEKKIDLSRFREKFFQEARDRIARMHSGLESLEKTPVDQRPGDDILREAHTLNGAAKMMGFARISELSHRFEEALSLRKDKKIASSQDLTDALSSVLDTLSRMIDALTEGTGETIDADGVLDRLRQAQVPIDGSVAKAPLDGPVAKAPREGPVVKTPHDAPAAKAAPPAAAPPGPTLEADRGPAHAPPDASHKIRVEPERLEQMANLLSDALGCTHRMVELRDLMGDLGRRYRRVGAHLLAAVKDAIEKGIISPDFAARFLPTVEEGSEVFTEIGSRLNELRRQENQESTALAQTLEDIRSETLAIRMVPLSPLFESFRQSVRDLSRKLGKEVEFLVRGGKTEIDRKVAEALTEPLSHLIRNAVDHGIEPAEVRAANGKPAPGKITVTATPKKGRVVIEVEDDGKGIDLQEIRETAVKKGLIAQKAAYRLDDRELLSLVFRPGFTTAKTMGEVSGRGIGMDVVRETAERFNGTVELLTHPGKGSKVVLELPFTMAVSRVLLFRVGSQNFGIPIMHSEGVHRFGRRDIVAVEGRRTVRFNGSPVPIVSLKHLLELGPPDPVSDDVLAVMVQHSQRRIALVVDDVEGEFEFVVKDLGSYLRKVPLFMGSSILGAGDIVLLLDVYDLVAAVRLRPEQAPPAEIGEPTKQGRILVMDESLLSREMQQRVIASAGYLVETASGPRDALDLLSRKEFDLVIAGVGRAGTDGVELVGRLRSKETLKDLPVVLVASREHGSDRERAVRSGAQECIDKEEFDVERLGPMISRLMARRGN
jgi:chemotaxis protein histidine kinase CheA